MLQKAEEIGHDLEAPGKDNGMFGEYERLLGSRAGDGSSIYCVAHDVEATQNSGLAALPAPHVTQLGDGLIAKLGGGVQDGYAGLSKGL